MPTHSARFAIDPNNVATMPPLPRNDDRDLARRIIEYGTTPDDLGPRQFSVAAMAAPRRTLGLDWPTKFEPKAAPLAAEPATFDPLPKADVLVVTWTRDEMRALADVLTPGVDPSKRWYRYDRKFEDYLPNIRPFAPARAAHRLGSYHPAVIGKRKVVCFKSELHMNQDGVENEAGKATLPVADLFVQMIDEVKPALVITVGTAGGTFADHELGDVVVTRAAKFEVTKEFRNQPYAGKTFKSSFTVPTARLHDALRLMQAHKSELEEPDFAPPTKRYLAPDGKPLAVIPGIKNDPDIKIDGRDFKAFLPILTTDFFEFGTSANRLDKKGCGVEMGDAALGLVCKQLGPNAPRWLVIRNVSDPVINADLPVSPHNMQTHWATWFYEEYGYWTSINSAIVTWAMIAK
jgi:nucleoside phosphorylase